MPRNAVSPLARMFTARPMTIWLPRSVIEAKACIMATATAIAMPPNRPAQALPAIAAQAPAAKAPASILPSRPISTMPDFSA